jgi:hypothetical protein
MDLSIEKIEERLEDVFREYFNHFTLEYDRKSKPATNNNDSNS